MNTVQVLGNLTKDVQIRRTNTGKSVASFTVAVNRDFIDQNGEKKQMTDYVPVTVWGQVADAVAQTLQKGARVFVSGRFNVSSYMGKDGEKKYKTEVIADFVAKPITAKVQSAGNSPMSGYMNPAQGSFVPAAGGNFSQFGMACDEDIPF